MDLTRLQHVLVRTPNWLGDAVMSVPALRSLRKTFTGAHLTIVAKRSIAGLYDGEGLADAIFLTDAASIFKGFREARDLRKMSWDLAVLLQNAFSAALIARAAGARQVAGYPTDGRRLLLNTVIPLDREHRKRHQAFYYLDIARHLEALLLGEAATDQIDPTPSLTASGEDLTAARQLLTAAGVAIANAAGEYRLAVGSRKASNGSASIKRQPGSAPIIALNPGATNSRAKRWAAERFAAVADRLAQLTGSRTIIIGTEGDREVASQVVAAMKSPAVLLAGKTGIGALKGVLAFSDLLVSNDTGAAHLAAAIGVPTVVVFGPTEHFATRPLSDDSEVVRQPVDCSPCMLRDCPIDHRCMTGISVEQVSEVALRKIGRPTPKLA